MTENSIQLPDKRELAYALFGPGDGEPILYFHGTPSSRLEPSLLDGYNIDLKSLLHKYNAHLISLDRPGLGLSTFNPKGDFISFANDVNFLTKELGVKKCKVMAWSGGGPFALCIAQQFPELISAVYIIAGFTKSFSEPGVFPNMHGNKLYFGAAKHIPAIERWIMNIALKKSPRKGIPQIISGLANVDHDLLSDVSKLRWFAATTAMEAVRNGSKGAVYEASLYFKDLGYKLNDITQPVHYWWGNEDKAVIKLHPEAVEQQAKNAVMHYKQHEGHLSIYINCFQEVLQTIKSL
jgi:pimeloyl-ACP methyl ester carboxylesterase